MKRLYDERSMHTKASQEFGEKIDAAIRPIFEEYLRQGFCVRDLSHEASGILKEVELGHILDAEIEWKRTERH